MKAGKSMQAAARSWKGKGKSKAKPKAKAKSKSKVARAKTGRKKTVAKRGGFNQQRVFKIVRLAALALPAVGIAMSGASTANKISQAKREYFGIAPDGRLDLASLAKGWGPFALSIALTYGIPKMAGLLRGL